MLKVDEYILWTIDYIEIRQHNFIFFIIFTVFARVVQGNENYGFILFQRIPPPRPFEIGPISVSCLYVVYISAIKISNDFFISETCKLLLIYKLHVVQRFGIHNFLELWKIARPSKPAVFPPMRIRRQPVVTPSLDVQSN